MSKAEERRKSKRLSVEIKAERLSCDKNCSVFIENLSESGINIITAPAKTTTLFEPGAEVELKLQTKNNGIIKLQCNVKWVYDNSPEDFTNNVGLEINNPPEDYLDFVRTL
jgi:uncharacterized cupredoxin-like copper-binding protein